MCVMHPTGMMTANWERALRHHVGKGLRVGGTGGRALWWVTTAAMRGVNDGIQGLLCLRWRILHSCMNRLKVAVALAGTHLVLGYHIPCLSSPLWTRGRGEVLDFVCSHRPQRFTQGKGFPDAAASSKGRVLPRVGCRGGGNSGWWRPLHYHNHQHHQHQVNKNRWGLCETVETRAGPLWQGGSHVRHMTPPCANLPQSWRQVDCAVRRST